MKYSPTQNINQKQLINLYNSVGWTAYTKNPTGLKAAINNSLLTIAAINEDKLVGLIRVVGDGVSIIYIQDLLVQPSYQKQGIGTHLVKLVLTKFQAVRQKVLLTIDEPETRFFYENCGFRSCDQGQLVAFYQEF